MEQSTIIRWQPFPDHTEFVIRYREKGQTEWYDNDATNSPHTINGLNPDKPYEYQVKGLCNTVSSKYSEIKEFRTAKLENLELNCNENPNIPPIDGSPELKSINVNDEIKIGGFNEVIKNNFSLFDFG